MLFKKLAGIFLLSATGVIYSDLSTAGSVGFSLRCINNINHTLVYSVTNEKQEDGSINSQSAEHEVELAHEKPIDIGTTETNVVIKDKSDNRILLQEEITCEAGKCSFFPLLSVKEYAPKITVSTFGEPSIVSLEIMEVVHS